MALVIRIEPWLAALAMMGLIFFLSAQPDLNTGLGLVDLIGRKIGHALLYALLCVLCWRALRSVLPDDTAVLAALLVAVAYAATDEYHQTFVRGRSGDPLDVAIDSAGALAAALALWRRG